MKFKWKNAFFALAVAAAAMALLAMISCAAERNVAGTIVSGIVICLWVFVAAGLHDEPESVDDDWSDWP